jgi:hypothetical protein
VLKTYTYQFDVAKMHKIPIVGGSINRIAAQSGIGIRYGRCTGKVAIVNGTHMVNTVVHGANE